VFANNLLNDLFEFRSITNFAQRLVCRFVKFSLVSNGKQNVIDLIFLMKVFSIIITRFC